MCDYNGYAYARVNALLRKPSGQLGAPNFSEQFAFAELSDVFTPTELGTWRLLADHYRVEYWYDYRGVSTGPPISVFLGSTDDSAIAYAGTFSLFLDVDENFNQTRQSDHGQFVPGATLAGGSVPLPQSVRLVAAYIDSFGHTVPPPPITNPITFSLSQVSSFRGYAMNAGSQEDADYKLLVTTPQWDPIYNTATVELQVLDYGGFARAKATHGEATDTFQLPVDADGDWLPDIGWRSHDGVPVSAGHGDEDADVLKLVPPPNPQGDGLNAFEEYRGFMARGEHRRLDPSVADLFVSSPYVVEGAGDAEQLPLTLHLLDEDTELALNGHVNFNSENLGQGGGPATHAGQKAIRIREGFLGSPGTFGEVKLDHALPCWPPAGAPPPCPQGQPPIQYNETYVYSWTIWHFSPPNNTTAIDTDPFDREKLRQTLGHEIGHNIGLLDFEWPTPNVCGPPYPETVMVTEYFPKQPTTDVFNCFWNHIPHDYTDLEKRAIRLRY